MPPLVIDTNIVLDLLVFEDLAAQPLRQALREPGGHWLATGAMRDELARVLGYAHIAPRLAQRGTSAAAVLAAFDRHANLVEPPARAAALCRDADDQKFIDLAVANRARLLSKDKAVLRMRKRLAALSVLVQPAWAPLQAA